MSNVTKRSETIENCRDSIALNMETKTLYSPSPQSARTPKTITRKTSKNAIEMQSAIYHGSLRHRRHKPTQNNFKYDVFMLYIDLDEIPSLLKLSPLFNEKRWSFAQLKRNDYLGDKAISIKQAVLAELKRQLNIDDCHKIRMLTNVRQFGFIINPISIYYCFDRDNRLIAMIAHVTNTPWQQSIAYALQCDPTKHKQRIQFDKQMHVSPFNPMHLSYDWRSNVPAEKLWVNIDVNDKNANNQTVLDATLILNHQPMNSKNLNRMILKFPFMTIKVMTSIYWQAVKLWLKKTPLHPLPKTKAP